MEKRKEETPKRPEVKPDLFCVSIDQSGQFPAKLTVELDWNGLWESPPVFKDWKKFERVIANRLVFRKGSPFALVLFEN